MKKIFIILTLATGVLAGGIMAILPVQAGKGFTADTIKGTYYFLVTEARNEGGTIQHCEGHGTANVFADGTMEICGPVMCNGVPGVPEAGYFTYVVAGDEILITEVGEPDSTHCKILDNGKTWLCDGGQRTNPDLWAWAGTVIKMSKKTTPEMLISEGCLP